MSIDKVITHNSTDISQHFSLCWLRRSLGRLNRAFFYGLLMPVCLLAQADTRHAHSNGNPSSTITSQNFAYLFGSNGAFLKIATDDGAVAAYWDLFRVEGASSFIPACHPGRIVDGSCNLLFGRLQGDAATGRLYGVFSTKDRDKSPDANRAYQVLILQMPEMKIVGSLPIAQAQPEPPKLLLTPDGKRLFVQLRDPRGESQLSEPSIASIVEIYDTSSLKPIANIREVAKLRDVRTLKTIVNTAFGADAYFDAAADMMFDELTVTAIGDNSMRRQFINPLEKLSSEDRGRLKNFEAIDAVTHKPWLDFVSGGSAAGRTLVRVNNILLKQAAYWTVDLRSGEDSPVILAPFSIAQLTPDGQFLLLNEAKVSENNENPGLLTTKIFRLYEVSTGKQISEFQNEDLVGSVSTNRLLCISAANKRVVFANGKKIRVIDLADGKTIAQVETRTLESSMATCLFSDR